MKRTLLFLMPALLTAGIRVLPVGGRNVRSIATAELDGDRTAVEIVGGCYDGRVSAFTLAGRLLWDARTGGFVHHLAARDLDGDGRDEVIAGSADGHVYVFGPTGKPLWNRDLNAPVTQVAAAVLEKGARPAVIAGGAGGKVSVFSATGDALAQISSQYVSVIRAADFDGDGADEIFLVTTGNSPMGREGAYTMRLLAGPRLREIYSGSRNSQPYQLRYAHATVADADGDGRPELVEPAGIAKWDRALRWISEFEWPDEAPASFDFNYRRMVVAAGDLTSDPGMETVGAYGPDIALLGRGGKPLGHVRAPQGFSDIAFVPGRPHGSVVLASAPNGDDNIYLASFEPGWETAFARLERRGAIARIAESIDTLSRQIRDWKGVPARGAAGPIAIDVQGIEITRPEELRNVERAIGIVKFYEKEFPYPRLRFATVLWITDNEKLMRPDGTPWRRARGRGYALSRDQISGIAREMERAGAHFWVQIGHANDPYMSPATAEAILRAAPTMCLGFVSAEDEGPDRAPYFLEHYIQPVMESCLRLGGRRVILREKNAWWASIAAIPEVRRILFNGRYRNVLLPSVEDSNSRSPDLNLAARVGLWLNGDVESWCSRMVSDCFSFNRATSYEYPMAGHPHLRYLTAHTALGASAFMIQVGQTDRQLNWTRVGAEGVAPFLRMLGKGIIAPPAREQFASLSPVLVSVQNPSGRYLKSGANGHRQSDFDLDDLIPRPFSRLDCYWGMSPTPDFDAAGRLWGRHRQFGNFIPVTEHGYVAVLPGALPASKRWTRVWTTDGDSLARDTRPADLSDMVQDLREGAASLPFQVDGEVFSQTIADGGDGFLLYLIDPGFVDPADRSVTVTSRNGGRWLVTDRLTGKQIGRLDTRLKVGVPAGTLRILEVRKIGPS